MITVRMQFDESGIFGSNSHLSRRIKYYKTVIPKEIAEIYANAIIEVAKAKFSHPRPYLVNYIKPKKMNDDSWIVTAPAYAAIVDRGRKPGKAPPASDIHLAQWAKAANINLFWLRYSIANHGTRPKNFIRPGMTLARARVRELMMRRTKG
jgi:hypothetical protein